MLGHFQILTDVDGKGMRSVDGRGTFVSLNLKAKRIEIVGSIGEKRMGIKY